jgi:hypothetical protein
VADKPSEQGGCCNSKEPKPPPASWACYQLYRPGFASISRIRDMLK